MEDKIDIQLMPCLEQRALRTAAAFLWNQDDIRPLTTGFSFRSFIDDYSMKMWRTNIEDKVKEKVSRLLLPKRMKEEISLLIPPIGAEILKWKYYHNEFLNEKLFEFFLTRKLCWTSLGTIDYKKTAELLVRSPKLDIVNRYRLACVYCLRDDIQSLWESLPEEYQNLFYNKKRCRWS
ncbi:hypothetical protein CDAR_518991 [Caerostris darwini]|uniref:Uncharacterized protein n=1 Tax=Caerostris darwini TaxID=1538125 RepID=A0AAV4PSB9_9ARAC|nr:hypothetical protein CDAR_518991 [Caerostris darwini]